MLMLVTYDVNTATPAGEKRIRRVAKLCEKYGIRVQNSVFEVLVNGAQLVKLKAGLSELIDEEEDSVRFYRLGNSYEQKIETMGRTPLIRTGGPMILCVRRCLPTIKHRETGAEKNLFSALFCETMVVVFVENHETSLLLSGIMRLIIFV